jgi:hypothetical protein
MASGPGVGDVIAVGKLAWDLYHDCFLVARGAPQEFRLLVDELKTLHASMKVFKEEFKDPNSVLSRAGEDRLRMVGQLVEQVNQTLKGLESCFKKHRNLGNASRSGVKRGWDKFRWSIDAKDVDGLRNKVLRFRPCLLCSAS